MEFSGFIVILVCDSKLLLNYLSYRNERWSEYFPWHVYWILNFCFKMGKFLLKQSILQFRELLWLAVRFYYTIVTGKCLLFT